MNQLPINIILRHCLSYQELIDRNSITPYKN